MTLKILSIETATEACSAALLLGDRCYEHFEIAPRKQAERILPMVDSLLVAHGLSLRDLDALAVGRGPGSFTGVRLEVSVAQGLAYGADLPISGISTLCALAQQAIRTLETNRVVVALDARMSEVYWAVFENQNGFAVPVTQERVSPPEEVSLEEGVACVGIGSGWSTYADILQAKVKPKTILLGRYPRARDIAILGQQAAAKGDLCDAQSLLPVYLRNKVV
jgi:tRNA threonylcarbamoyladenosine biosynthesis protein TsaB